MEDPYNTNTSILVKKINLLEDEIVLIEANSLTGPTGSTGPQGLTGISTGLIIYFDNSISVATAPLTTGSILTSPNTSSRTAPVNLTFFLERKQ
jgi:hypothetical protein